MTLDDTLVRDIEEKILKAERILLISHRRPDADTIGANLSMRRALTRLGKKVVSACHDEITFENYFLPDVYVYTQDFGDLNQYDLVITVDCGDSKITDYHNDYTNLLSSNTNLINIDHHVSNDLFGQINLVRSDFASTTEILFCLYNQLGWKIDKDMATLLLAGLYFDTGSFKHDNTSVHVLKVAAELMEKGAKAELIAKQMFRVIPIPVMKAWGRVFERAKMNDQNIVTSFITIDEIKDIDGATDDIKGSDLITYLNSIPGARFSMLLSEKKGLVKGSFRTSRDDVDVAKIAKKMFKGGGHKKAAGFAVPGKLMISDNGRIEIKEEA